MPRTLGVHVCEGCGKVYGTLGPYWACQESHPGLVVPPADIYLGERPDEPADECDGGPGYY